MNYIKEINAFYDWLETNSLSSSAIALWHALMHICNKSGWTTEFAVAVSTLSTKTGLSPRTVLNARNELKMAGRISWKSRKGNQSAIYTIIPFHDDLRANDAHNLSDNASEKILHANIAHNASHNVSYNVSHNASDNASTLLNETKLNETKHKNTDDDEGGGLPQSRAVAFFANNFGNFSPFIADEIEKWVSELSENIVIAAMKLALKRNAKNFGYVESILKEWHAEGLKTIDQVRTYENARKERQQTKNQVRRVSERVDKLPKWVTNDMPNRKEDEKDVKQREKELDEILSRL